MMILSQKKLQISLFSQTVCPVDKFSNCFGHPDDFLVVMDNWRTVSMDPAKAL